TGQAVEEGAFSRPVRPDDCPDFIASDFKVDAVERSETAEADCQQLRAEKRSWRFPPGGWPARADRYIRSHFGRVPVMLRGVAPRVMAGLVPGHPDYPTSPCHSKRPKSTSRRGEFAAP